MSDQKLPHTDRERESKKSSAAEDLRRRIRSTKPSRWCRFGIVAALFTGWVIWLGNPWVLLLLPLLFDIYITGYIPFTWWKKSKNKALVMVMSWVDAIVYALILVYFVFTFVGQNYQIPSSSLEKTLLTGDYLWVNKMTYGPRVPMTPIHFPLVQNTMPFFNTKSYTEWPQWKYHRLKGWGNVEAGDIVVFNFPAGDTVAVARQNPDYYTLKKYMGDSIIATNARMLAEFQNLPVNEALDLRDRLGAAEIKGHPEKYGKMVYHPVDRRENYVKRAVGLPGDTLSISDGYVYINGKRQSWPEEAQFNYVFQTRVPLSDQDWDDLGVSVEDRRLINIPGDMYSYYTPLTDGMVQKLKSSANLVNISREPTPTHEYVFPDRYSDVHEWTRSDYGPLWIPKKGATVKLTAENWPLYERVIRNYEHHTDSYVKEGRVYVDGKPADEYTFEMDYYFMMGDNRDNSLDSRYWGFVPEDHIVGKPMRILISFDRDKSLFNGGIRWNRILKNANTGF